MITLNNPIKIQALTETSYKNQIKEKIKSWKNSCEYVGVRFVDETTQNRTAINGKLETNLITSDQGVMIEVMMNGQLASAATSDVSLESLEITFQSAREKAQKTSSLGVFKFTPSVRPKSEGRFRSPRTRGLDDLSLEEFTSTLIQATEKLKSHSAIISSTAMARIVESRHYFLSSEGSEIEQDFLLINPHFAATAKHNGETQTRSANGPVARSYQIGLEILARDLVFQTCDQVTREAVELVHAENCPTGTFNLILAPDQMLLQIHESIGHPLEVDRILGDERNFAGWSFVQLSDFGKLQYGSKLMNITFDPSYPGEFASYAFDDGGAKAEKQYLIKDGILVRGLGGLESQVRSGVPGVSNFRASSWNRAPIDRMANINLEPGQSTFKEMIEQTEYGVIMQSNTSWSIDDYRNKFQFGCEYGQLIENGKITKVLKNPNYRGVTVPFWNSLKAVGDSSDTELFGSPFCGKGEPSQIIRVGHASPHCLFEKVEIFGGGH